jgi:Ca-activated chloride channel family protein
MTATLEPARFRLLVVPERAAWPAGFPTTLRFLVRVQAPERQPTDPQRAPLSIALVLDRSGSMSGQPLDEARKCATTVIDRLEPRDRVAVFAFDDEVECFAPATPASERSTLRAAVERIVEGGSTDLHGGWRAGADALAALGAEPGLRRVVVLSDGCANCGETGLEAISGQCRDLARQGVTTSTYGLGRAFNEVLMQAMAQAGRGNAYYGETALDLADPFNEEFDLLSSLCVRQPVLKVSAPSATAVRVRNDYEAVASDAPAWRLPDLAFDAEAWAIVEVDLPGLDAGASVDPTISVSVEAGAEHGAPLYLISAAPALPCVDASAFAAQPIEPLFARRLDEIAAAETLARVRSLLVEGNVAEARNVLGAARERFAHSEWVRTILDEMQRLIDTREAAFSAKEAFFSSMKLSRRLAALNEPSAASEQPIPSFLRRKSRQGKGQDAS